MDSTKHSSTWAAQELSESGKVPNEEDNIRKRINKLNSDYQKIEKNEISDEYDNYDIIVSDAAKIINEVVNTQSKRYKRSSVEKRYERIVGECTEITFKTLINGIRIVYNRNLPKRTKNGKAPDYDINYYKNSLYTAFKKYSESNEIFFRNKVIIRITQHYLNWSEAIDHDNVDTKVIIDMISNFFLIDDNPLRCSIIMDAALSDHYYTEIIVTEEFKERK